MDADVPSDDPVVGHPWADEILHCADLEKMLQSLLPKEAAAGGGGEEADKAWLKGAAGKMSGREAADPYAEARVVKKNKGPRRAADAAAVRLVLTMDTVAGLATAGVPIPVTAADLPACLAQVHNCPAPAPRFVQLRPTASPLCFLQAPTVELGEGGGM